MASPTETPSWEKRGMCGCKGCAVAYQRGREDAAKPLRELHIPCSHPIDGVPCCDCLEPICVRCEQSYPCDTIRVLDGEQK